MKEIIKRLNSWGVSQTHMTNMILHVFIKKQQATSKQDLDLAKERLKILKRK